MPPTPPTPTTPSHKSVTFCNHCDDIYSDQDVKYYSDPGYKDKPKQKPKKEQLYSTDSDQRYYSEPDVKYFEIDYAFLKELRKIARNNCPKCRRKRSRNKDKERSRKEKRSTLEKSSDAPKYTKSLDRKTDRPKYAKTKKPTRNVRMRENYVFCNGRYHSDKEHCQLCCKICNRSTDTLDSIDDEYSLVSKSYSSKSRSKSNPPKRDSKNVTRERKNSIQSIKSVSFLEGSPNEEKDETNYTAKSFTNDLKKFLLRPSTPRLSFRDKFMNSFKQEIEATKKSPKLKAIKGLWKSY